MWVITCMCGFKGSTDDFDMSLCDECSCPKCGENFIVDDWGKEDEDDGEVRK